LTLAQEFRETKNWLVEHKRDPFLWLVILGPLVLAAFTFWGVVVFPPSDATRTIREVLPSASDITVQPKNFPSCGAKKYVFGYDFGIKTDGDPDHNFDGRICRDVVNGGWVLDIDPKFEYLKSR
jgi:hypothetical protein